LQGVSYKGESIKNLSVSKVVIWNNGGATISKKDIDKDEPLKIVAENNIIILDAKVIEPGNKRGKFSVSLSDDRTSATISFKESSEKSHKESGYLDRYEGIIVRLVHTGTSSAKVNTVGKIIGGLKLKRGHLESSPHGEAAIACSVLGVLSVVEILLAGVTVGVNLVALGVGFFFIVFGLIIFFITAKRPSATQSETISKIVKMLFWDTSWYGKCSVGLGQRDPPHQRKQLVSLCFCHHTITLVGSLKLTLPLTCAIMVWIE